MKVTSKGPSFAAREAFRSVFTGATIRALAGIRDLGEIAIAKVRGFEGADPIDVQDSDEKDIHDVWVDVRETLTELPRTVVLFFAGNTLFALPEEGDDVFTVRAQDVDVPGGPLGLFGFGGLAGLPAWIRTKVGLWNKRTVRVESSENDVEIHCADADGKKVVVVAGNSSFTVKRNDDVELVVLQDGKKFIVTAGNTTFHVEKDGPVRLTAASGQDIVMNGGSTPVAIEGSGLNVGTLQGQAGPYPVIFTYSPGGGHVPSGGSVSGPQVALGGVVESGQGSEHVLAP